MGYQVFFDVLPFINVLETTNEKSEINTISFSFSGNKCGGFLWRPTEIWKIQGRCRTGPELPARRSEKVKRAVGFEFIHPHKSNEKSGKFEYPSM